MLGHARARRGGDEHRAGRDVEAVAAVAAGADDVDEVAAVGHLHGARQFTHHLRGGGNLADGFLLHAQAGEDRRRHHR